MKKLFFYLRYRWLLYQWQRRSKKKRRCKVRVGRLDEFFAALATEGIAYVVLRWFAEVPVGREAEKSFVGDLDLLVESSQLEAFCRVVARFPGSIKVDLYSNGIRLGTDCKRIAYYPPILGTELLRERTVHEGRFYRPAPRQYLYSLLYHCVYQKGLLCGLPTGTDLPNQEQYGHDLLQELAQVAAECGETLPQQLTLLALHQWLQEREWNMPYDLLGRWPTRNAWHEELLQLETEKLQQELKQLKDLMIFLLRADATQAGAATKIVDALSQKFRVLEQVSLDQEQQERVMRQTRGGDWTKHKGTFLVPPVLAVICRDPAPVAVDPQSALGRQHPFVTNSNVFHKQEIRRQMEAMYPEAAANFLHGSDNDAESMAYIKAIYGQQWLEKLAQWQSM